MELKIDKKTAKRLYPESPEWFKVDLNEAFGEDCFRKKRFDEIITFADACEECGITEEEFNERFSNLGLDNDTINYEKLKIVVKAINNGWTPDWNNDNEKKWFPIFNRSSGFGFRPSDFVFTGAYTYVGSRLCFESEQKSDYAAKQFIEIYKNFLT